MAARRHALVQRRAGQRRSVSDAGRRGHGADSERGRSVERRRPTPSSGPTAWPQAPDGSVWMVQHGARQIVRVAPDHTLTPVVSRFEGKRFNSPNDLVFAKDGALYFTDPPYGLAKQDDDPAKELTFNGVYRFANGRVQAVVRDLNASQWPGVLARLQDPLRQQLGPGEEPRHALRRRGGRHARERARVCEPHEQDRRPGRRDESRCARGTSTPPVPAASGFCHRPARISVRLNRRRVPANCAWGDDGKTLYMTAVTGVYRVRTLVGR